MEPLCVEILIFFSMHDIINISLPLLHYSILEVNVSNLFLNFISVPSGTFLSALPQLAHSAELLNASAKIHFMDGVVAK